jgi:uncharacterized protein (DUF305 family)
MSNRAILVVGAVDAMTVGRAISETQQPAQMAGMDHSSMDVSGAMKDYMATLTSMPMKSTDDADADFLAMMISHHQSAISMAEIELAEGDDDDTRAGEEGDRRAGGRNRGNERNAKGHG